MSSRHARWEKLERARALCAADGATRCAICQDDVDRDATVVVTLCNHVFHRGCWSRYVHATVQEIAVDQVEDAQEAHYTLNAMLLLGIAGPRCPMCRTSVPLLHRMTLVQNDLAPVAVQVDVTALLTSVCGRK